MLDKFFKRSIEMMREEKGVWNRIYRILIQFREEAISRVFRFLRRTGGLATELFKSVASLLDDKKDDLESLLERQIRLIAEKEQNFLKDSLSVNMSKYPRKLTKVQGNPLFKGSTSWTARIFAPIKKKLRKSLQFSISRKSPIEDVVDRVFGKDTPKEIKIGNWRGNEFQGGVLSRLRSNLKTLVTTSFYEIVFKVRKFAFSRADRVGALRSVAVLDNRTTAVCRSYDGLLYQRRTLKPIGHNQKFIPTPRHWNCRSQHIPDEIDGVKLDKIPFEEWFKKLSNVAQDSLLGSSGGEKYRKQQNSLESLLKRLSPRYVA